MRAIVVTSVLGVVLCWTVVCTGIKSPGKTRDDLPSEDYENNLLDILKADQLFFADDVADDAEKCEDEMQKKCEKENKKCVKNTEEEKCGDCLTDYVKNGKGECKITCNDDCQHGGECNEDGDGKFCVCKKGLSGDKCQDIDDCLGKFINCRDEKGTCTYDETSEAAICSCSDDKILHPIENICKDPCLEIPCMNNGICKVENKAFHCVCQDPYIGLNCETEDLCFQNPCKNGGTCQMENSSFKCVCTDGYFGSNCEIKDLCLENPCKNGGTCQMENINFKCLCTDGYLGLNCETKDLCLENPCKNGGTCQMENNNFKCLCTNGYLGSNCETKDLCLENPCKNGGTCQMENINFKCVCTNGYLGSNCETKDLCFENPCKNGGTCQMENNSFKCVCPDGYSGSNCETKVTCATGGKAICDQLKKICVDKSTGYECGDCIKDFSKDSDGICKECTCGDKTEKCVIANTGEPNCTCEEGFAEKNKICTETCENSEECKHNGTCGEDKFCECNSGFSGDRCEIIDECQTERFKNCKGDKGTCQINELGEVECKCFDNKKLDNQLHICRAECKVKGDCNNGICTDKFCRCNEGYIGDFCEIIEDCQELRKECEKAGALCKYDPTAKAGYCDCKDQNYAYVDKTCKTAKWCHPNPCDAAAECVFKDGFGSCKCNDSEAYYDYKNNGCKAIDPCLSLKSPCGKNEICDSSNGKCKCMDGFEKEGEECKAKFCKENSCFRGGICSESAINKVIKCSCKATEFFKDECLDGSCFLPGHRRNCSADCPAGMKKNKDGDCEHEEGKNCDKKCGYGWCIKNEKEEKCVCKDDEYTFSKEGTCVLKPTVCASNKVEKDNPMKCNCSGMYKLAENEITCEKKSCADDDVQKECKSKNAQCVDFWKSGRKGYQCKCQSGYRKGPGDVCIDECSIQETRETCSAIKGVCLLTNTGALDCKCPPTFKMSAITGKGCEPDDKEKLAFILHNLPVRSERYVKDKLVDKIQLNKDIIDAMESIFLNTELDFARLYSYKLRENYILCEIWLQFKKEPTKGVKSWIEHKYSKNDNTFLPPGLILSSNKLDDVKSEELTFCSDVVKQTLCGNEAVCDKKKCSCKDGFKVIESTIVKFGEAVLVRCEDINECDEGIHQCSSNTTCVNTLGDYYCKCVEGFKKTEGPATGETKYPCTDLCSPNPCVKGQCKKTNNTVDCTCEAGYGGSFCNKKDVNFAKASKNTVIVGAVLGTLLGVTIILILLYIWRQRKNSYSEDFTPPPRMDNAEMVDRRPMRGVSNRAYQ